MLSRELLLFVIAVILIDCWPYSFKEVGDSTPAPGLQNSLTLIQLGSVVNFPSRVRGNGLVTRLNITFDCDIFLAFYAVFYGFG